MEGAKSQFDDDIDLVEIVQTIWDGKWKILGAVVVSFVSVFGYLAIAPPNFKAAAEIKPISSVDADRYSQSNALGFFVVTPDTLLNLYIEQLDRRSLFEEAIRKNQLLDVGKFADKQAYEEAVVALASSIELLPPINVDGADKKLDSRRFWTIGFEFNDSVKWKQVLSSVDSLANESVLRILQERFKTSLSVAKQTRDFGLEDTKLQIANALADYDRKTSDRLAYLREQASIARKLGVAKNTIEAQTFNAQTGVVANVKTDTPFYLRGYEAIEKEIQLIKSRTQKEAFVGELLALEQKQRALKQDRTLERAEALITASPIFSANDFSAASVTLEATTFEMLAKRIRWLVAAVVIGGMVGVLYVLLSSAIRNRKNG
jgi:LPS O-antigen subunit length determinant protein (WzzB/FepE family)